MIPTREVSDDRNEACKRIVWDINALAKKELQLQGSRPASWGPARRQEIPQIIANLFAEYSHLRKRGGDINISTKVRFAERKSFINKVIETLPLKTTHPEYAFETYLGLIPDASRAVPPPVQVAPGQGASSRSKRKRAPTNIPGKPPRRLGFTITYLRARANALDNDPDLIVDHNSLENLKETLKTLFNGIEQLDDFEHLSEEHKQVLRNIIKPYLLKMIARHRKLQWVKEKLHLIKEAGGSSNPTLHFAQSIPVQIQRFAAAPAHGQHGMSIASTYYPPNNPNRAIQQQQPMQGGGQQQYGSPQPRYGQPRYGYGQQRVAEGSQIAMRGAHSIIPLKIDDEASQAEREAEEASNILIQMKNGGQQQQPPTTRQGGSASLVASPVYSMISAARYRRSPVQP